MKFFTLGKKYRAIREFGSTHGGKYCIQKGDIVQVVGESPWKSILLKNENCTCGGLRTTGDPSPLGSCDGLQDSRASFEAYLEEIDSSCVSPVQAVKAQICPCDIVEVWNTGHDPNCPEKSGKSKV